MVTSEPTNPSPPAESSPSRPRFTESLAALRARRDSLASQVRREAYERYREHRDAQEILDRTRGLFSRARLPALHLGLASRRPWPNPAVWDSLRAAMAARGIAVLLGGKGRGKTQMCVDLILEAVAAGKASEYWRADDLFDDLRALFETSHEEARRRRDVLEHLGLLVIDALEDSRNTEFEAREFRRLIDKRYAARSPTVLVSNLTLPDFNTLVGESVSSRIEEAGTVLLCGWASFRRPHA